MRDRRYKKLTVRAFAVGTGLSVIVGTFAAPLTTMAAAKDMEKPVVLRYASVRTATGRRAHQLKQRIRTNLD